MKKGFRIILSLLVSIIMLSSNGGEAFAVIEGESNIGQILNQWESAINSKNVQQYLDLYDNEMASGLNDKIIYPQEEEKRFLEFFSINNVAVGDVKKLTDTDLNEVYPSYFDTSLPHEIYYFYFDAQINEGMENKYTVDGKNYRLCVITQQGGEWKISQLSTAPVAPLVNKDINLGTEKEADIESRIRQIKESQDIDKLTDSQLMQVESSSTLSSVSEPEYIRVMFRDTERYEGQTNYEYWNKPINGVANIPFKTYYRDVLPNELFSDMIVPEYSDPSTYRLTALQAGALMVKTFGWYMILHPWNNSAGADVNDDKSQRYLHNSRTKYSQDQQGIYFEWGNMCQNAFSQVSNIVIWNLRLDEPIEATYVEEDQQVTYQMDDQEYSLYSMITYIYDDFRHKYDTEDIYFKGVTSADPFEPNENSQQAAELEVYNLTWYAHDYISSATDQDWYKVYIPHTGQYSCSLTASNITNNPYGSLPGNYDMEVYGPDYNWIAGSYNPGTAVEKAYFNANNKGYYFFRIKGQNGEFSTSIKYKFVLSHGDSVMFTEAAKYRDFSNYGFYDREIYSGSGTNNWWHELGVAASYGGKDSISHYNSDISSGNTNANQPFTNWGKYNFPSYPRPGRISSDTNTSTMNCGIDSSGLVQRAAQAAGSRYKIAREMPLDSGDGLSGNWVPAAGFANYSTPVTPGDLQTGDIAYRSGHIVMFAKINPNNINDCRIIEATQDSLPNGGRVVKESYYSKYSSDPNYVLARLIQ